MIGKILSADSRIFERTTFVRRDIAMIQKSRGKVLGVTGIGSRPVAILATQNSMGLERSDGTIRTPHQGWSANDRGESQEGSMIRS